MAPVQGALVAILQEMWLILRAWLLMAALLAVPVAGLWIFVPRARRLGPQRHRSVPWSGSEVLFAFLGLMFWSALFTYLLVGSDAPPGPAGQPRMDLRVPALVFL